MNGLYRYEHEGTTGWWVTSGPGALPPDEPGWRPATGRERVRHFFTSSRFSIVGMVVIIVLQNIVAYVVRALLS